MQLVRIVAEHRDPRSRSGEATRHVRRLTERRRADDEDRVERLQPLAQPRPLRRQNSAIQPVVLREAGAASERLLEDGSHEPLCQLDERRPGLRVVGTRTDDQRRRLRLREEARERVDSLGVDGGAAQDGPERGRRLALLVGGLVPVVHRHDHERRTALRLCGMERPLDRGRNVLGPGGLVDADGILTGEAGQLPGEERLVGEMPTVLLSHDDHERRAVHTGGREGADPRAEPGRRVQEDESRPAAADRQARSEPDHGGLVQPEDEADVVRQVGEERDLRRPGVREHRRQPAPAEDVECRVSDGAQLPQTSSATSTRSRSLAACCSTVSSLPSTVDAKPHCGDRQS